MIRTVLQILDQYLVIIKVELHFHVTNMDKKLQQLTKDVNYFINNY